MRPIALLTLLVAATVAGRAELQLAREGVARSVIIVDPAATATEAFAARELPSHLRQITGAEFSVQTNTRAPRRAILVGGGNAARQTFAKVPFDALGPEELVIKTKGNHLLLAGGRPRGTLYAVSRFLQDQCKVRWCTPWASRIPQTSTLRVSNLNTRAKPAFESRDPYWFPAFDRQWAVRNFSNSQSAGIP